MNVLVACEFSGIVRDAFRARGHQAYSCDLFTAAGPDSQYHLETDVRLVLNERFPWDLMIAHPPCTYLCSSGLHWNKRRPERAAYTEQALEFVQLLLDANVPKICLENPIGCISTRIRKPDQIIHPYEFGHNAAKATCLWLKGLPPLQPTVRVSGRLVDGKERWFNQCDSGQNRLGPSAARSNLRATTYKGIADAMAEQWG